MSFILDINPDLSKFSIAFGLENLGPALRANNANGIIWVRIIKMKMLKISQEEAGSIFESLFQKYKIIAPVEKIGEGRFSNTSLLAYAEVGSLEEIDFFRKTQFSAKEFFSYTAKFIGVREE